jgi:hypothetical protein
MATGPAKAGNSKVPPNSFETRLSEAFSGLRASTDASAKAVSLSHVPTALARHEIAAVRQNLVKVPVAAQKQLASLGSTASSPMATVVAVANTVSVIPAATPAVTVGPDIPTDPVAALLQQNAPPSAYAPGQQPSTDMGVYSNPDYLMQSNLNLIQQQTNHENQYRFDVYKNGVQNWAANGMQGDPPAAPKYENVDVKGFNQWWDQYTQNVGQNAPPETFISNQIANNGYYGAQIWQKYSG